MSHAYWLTDEQIAQVHDDIAAAAFPGIVPRANEQLAERGMMQFVAPDAIKAAVS